MTFTFKEDVLYICNVLLPCSLPVELRAVILQYSGHLTISNHHLSWILFN